MSISAVSAGTHNLSPGNSIKSTIIGDKDSNIGITLSSGTYSNTNDYNIDISDMDNPKSVTIKGSSAQSTIIDLANRGRLFKVGNGNKLTLINLTIKNGKAPAVINDDVGGAIDNSGSVTLTGCTFINNTALGGGAIYNGNYGSVTITSCTFINNSANFWGGAIASWDESTLTIDKTTFTNNKENNNNLYRAIYIENSDVKFTKTSVTITPADGTNINPKIATSLVIINFKPLLKKSNTIKATLRDKNGKVLNGEWVELWINGKLYPQTYHANKAGVITYKNIIFKKRDVYKIQFKFIGSDSYLASNSKVLSLTPKDKTTIKLAKFVAERNKKTTFKATLKNHKNKAMVKKVVKFYVNGKPIGQARTNKKGVAILTKKVTKKGTVNFIAKYAGDKNNHNSDHTRKITAK